VNVHERTRKKRRGNTKGGKHVWQKRSLTNAWRPGKKKEKDPRKTGPKHRVPWEGIKAATTFVGNHDKMRAGSPVKLVKEKKKKGGIVAIGGKKKS